MQLKLKQTFVTVLALAVIVSAEAAAQRLNPKLKAKDHAVRRVVVLPAQVQLVRSGVKGAEPMEKESAEMTPVLEQVVAKAFEKKNFSVTSGTFGPQALEGDAKMKYAVADLQRNFDELFPKVMKKQKDIEKGRFSLGDQVLLLNQDDTADAYVFVRAFGQQKTKGKVAFNLLMMFPDLFPACFVYVTVVDARTGEVLAHSTTATIGNVVKDTDKALGKGLDKSLKKIPPPPATEKAAAEKSAK
jgi:hypothetical protein